MYNKKINYDTKWLIQVDYSLERGLVEYQYHILDLEYSLKIED